jgi:GNAT superfamily N-acetyltransferase
MSLAFRIRAAVPADIPAVVALIAELAEFEHLTGPDQLAAGRLEEHAFGATPRCQILVADADGAGVVGYAVYFMTYSTFLAKPSLYLEDLFVKPAFRRQGIATGCLRELAAIAVARGAGRFEWAVLDWNVAAQQFYVGLGAKVLPDWRVCRMEGDALASLAGTGIAEKKP